MRFGLERTLGGVSRGETLSLLDLGTGLGDLPRMAVQRRIYRLRFLNASNARSYEVKLGNGRQMLQIASDGGLLEKPVRRREVPIFPAERVEIVGRPDPYSASDEGLDGSDVDTMPLTGVP